MLVPFLPLVAQLSSDEIKSLTEKNCDEQVMFMYSLIQYNSHFHGLDRERKLH